VGAQPADAGPPPSVQVHEQQGLEVFTEDVLVFRDNVLQNPDGTTTPDSEVYNIVGAPTGITWGQWTAATIHSGVAVVTAHSSTRSYVAVSMTHLIPNALYSLFYTTFGPDSVNQSCLGVERALPLHSINPRQQPDPASFVADPPGRASFLSSEPGSLLAPDQLAVQLIYHFDGHSYYPLPNEGEYDTAGPNCRSSFAADALRQTLILENGYGQ